MKTTLSPESQHDSAGSRPSQNLLFFTFFEVSNLNGLFGTLCFRLFMIFSDFGRPFAHHFGVVLSPQKTMQNGVSKKGVGGKGTGPSGDVVKTHLARQNLAKH